MTGAGRAAAWLTLVTGGRAGTREAAIAGALAMPPPARPYQPDQADQADHHAAAAPVGIILEGLADAASSLAALATGMDGITVVRIAPGCLCCTGNLVLRVTLNRLLRQRPARLFISLADSGHLAALTLALQSPPYDTLLQLTPDLHVAPQE